MSNNVQTIGQLILLIFFNEIISFPIQCKLTTSGFKSLITSIILLGKTAIDNVSFDEKVASSGRAAKAYVLIWNFSDLIHPQLVLQSPQEVQCFRINPTNPNLIAGGTSSGQIILWDTTESMQSLKNIASSRRKGNKDDEEEQKSLPPLQPAHVTTIDNSHRRPVSASFL